MSASQGEITSPPFTPDSVLRFWFDETPPKAWWAKSDAFDRLVAERFADLYRRAAAGELEGWRATPQGRLAEVIVLDQFSRNLFRGRPESFACDAQALALAQAAIMVGADAELTPQRRAFLYMPFVHSEAAAIHARAVKLLSAPGLEDALKSELRHKAVIDRFGRFPHRNAILGRTSRPEEIAFLKTPNSRF